MKTFFLRSGIDQNRREKHSHLFAVLVLLLVSPLLVNAQAGQCLTGGCTFGGVQFPGGTFTTSTSAWTTVSTVIYAGEWQEYSVVAGNTYEWSLCAADGGSAPYDAQLTLYNTSGTRLCYSDDLCGNDSKIQWTATFTGNVRTLVSRYSCLTNTIITTLVWRVFTPIPANDACSSATAVSAGSFAASTVSATGTDISSCGFSDTEDVWYSATNTSTVARRFTIASSGSTFDPVLTLYGGTCAGLVELACDDDGGPGTESLLEVDCIQPSQTVYLRLSGHAGAEGTTTLTLSSTPDPVAPTLSCPSNITVNAEAGYCEAYVNYLPPWADSSGAGNYTGGGILYEPIPGTGTAVTLSDDQVSGAIPLGFSFNFYGNSYSNAYVSSNGFLSFDASAPNGCCAGQLIPDATAPNNLIAFAWEDLNPTLGGTIRYFSAGTAPNRIFVLNFNAVQHHPGGNPVTTQLQLHEGIGVIEIHTTSMPSDGGNHTMGIENADGTAATFVTGRLASNWSTSNEGIQFIPPNNTADDCGLAYTEQIAGLGFSAYFDVGSTTETYEITDLAGNQQTCSFTVTVVDNQPPFVNSCPADVVQVSNEPDCGGRVVNYTQQFGDNCHGYVSGSLVSGLASGSVFPIGTTAVSWSFDDGNGNPPATCAFNVTITEPTVLSSELNLSSGCASCSVSDGQTRTFYDQNGHYLMTLQDDLALPSALGNTTVCNLASAAPTADDEDGNPVPVLARFWRVNPTVNGPADLTVHFTAAEYTAMRTHPSATGIYAIGSLADVCFTRYPSGTGPGFATSGGQAVPVMSITDNGDGTYSAVLDMAGFSDVYCHACSPFGGPLPVTLLTFTGEHEDGANVLRWVTATEAGVSHFELERAAEPGVFENITKVMSEGNSTTQKQYAYQDRDFPPGGHFYRLRTVDHDGSEALSPLVYLGQTVGQSWSWSVFPNPATDQATVSLSLPAEAAVRVKVVDALGRIHQSTELLTGPGALQIPLNTSSLPEGLYQLWLTVEGGPPSALPLIILQP